jgi:DNA-damage-inducible protein D
MTDRSLPVSGSVTFEELKKTNEHGAEYWSARELQPLLGYGQWRRFEDAINRAMTSCGQSGNNHEYHFAGAGKMITGGISHVEKRIKNTPPFLELDGSDAKGLIGTDGE